MNESLKVLEPESLHDENGPELLGRGTVVKYVDKKFRIKHAREAPCIVDSFGVGRWNQAHGDSLVDHALERGPLVVKTRGE